MPTTSRPRKLTTLKKPYLLGYDDSLVKRDDYLTFVQWWIVPKGSHWHDTPEHLRFTDLKLAQAAQAMLQDTHTGENLTANDLANYDICMLREKEDEASLSDGSG